MGDKALMIVRGVPEVACHDCHRPYGDEHGFPDLVIEPEAWAAISPARNSGGLLCPSCICLRLHEAGLTTMGAFTSGPVRSVDVEAMSRLVRAERAWKSWEEEHRAMRAKEA